MATQKKNKIKIKDLPAGKKAKGVKGGGYLKLMKFDTEMIKFDGTAFHK